MNFNSMELDGYSNHLDKCWNRTLKYPMTDILIIYEYPSIWYIQWMRKKENLNQTGDVSVT